MWEMTYGYDATGRMLWSKDGDGTYSCYRYEADATDSTITIRRTYPKIDGVTQRVGGPVLEERIRGGKVELQVALRVDASIHFATPSGGGDPYPDPAGDETGVELYRMVATRDPFGRLSDLERQAADVPSASANISYDSFGQVCKLKDSNGTIVRTVRDNYGRVERVFRGSNDQHEVWGTTIADEDPCNAVYPDNMTLFERRDYGYGVRTAGQVTAISKYRDRPLNQYRLVGCEGTPSNNEGTIGIVERHQFDARLRDVWAATYPDGNTGTQATKITTRYFDNLNRERFTAVFSGDAIIAGGADPRGLAIDSPVPTPSEILAAHPLELSEKRYDSMDRVIETRMYDVSVADGTGYTASRSAMDESGRVVWQQDSGGRITENHGHLNTSGQIDTSTAYRNESWWLDRLGGWSGDSTNPGQRIARLINGSTTTTDTTQILDQFNALKSLRKQTGSTVTTTSTARDGAGNLICDGIYVYQYDAFNRLVQVNDKGGVTVQTNGTLAGTAGPWVKHFTYDGLGRLIRTQSPWPWPDTAPAAAQSERYYYDGYRRIQKVLIDPIAYNNSDPGNKDPIKISKEVDLTQIHVQYNATVEREYVWDPVDTDRILCQYQGGSNPYFITTDQTWTPTAQLDSAGHITDQFTYDPYGTLLTYDDGGLNALGVEMGHQGLFFDRLDVGLLNGDGSENPKQAVGAVGIYYNRARTYSPQLGRFLQADPNATGMLLPSAARSRMTNRISRARVESLYGDGNSIFEYLGGNPVSHCDPDGTVDWNLPSLNMNLAGQMILNGAIGGVTGAVSGALNNPDHPVAGAIGGFVGGLISGALSTYAGAAVNANVSQIAGLAEGYFGINVTAGALEAFAGFFGGSTGNVIGGLVTETAKPGPWNYGFADAAIDFLWGGVGGAISGAVGSSDSASGDFHAFATVPAVSGGIDLLTGVYFGTWHQKWNGGQSPWWWVKHWASGR